MNKQINNFHTYNLQINPLCKGCYITFTIHVRTQPDTSK